MKRILSLVLAILVYCMSITSVLGALFPTATVVATAATTDNSSKRLKLSSNTTGARYHVDQNGNPVNLFGMARCQSHAVEEETANGGNVNALARHYSNYGMNYMRLAINVRGIIGDNVNASLKLTTDAEIDAWIKKNVDPDVKAIIGEGMYVGLDLHMISISGVDDAKKLPADTVDKYIRANYLPILKRLTNYYKNEPMIANVEIWNEPSIGVPTGTNGVGWRETLRNYFLDVVKELRKIDSTRILMVSDDNAGWGWNINSFWTKDLIKQLGDNVVFSAHVCHNQFDTNADHEYLNYGNNFLKAVANSNNICIFLNEIENEPASSTDYSIINICKFFEDNKDTYHFAGCLWRPMSDYLDRTRTWGSNGWAARYTGKTLKLDPTRNWFMANGYDGISDWGSELTSIPNNGNEVKAAGTVTSYSAEYVKVKKATGDILFTKNNYHSTTNNTPTDLAGYEYVIVKLKFANEASAVNALNATSSSAFISLDGTSVVTFANYKSALQANADKAKAGELVALVLPLAKKLDSCYKALTMKLAADAEVHFYTIDFVTSAYANEFKAANGDVYNVKTLKTYAGPTYTMQGRPWNPQLSIGVAEEVYTNHNFNAIKMDIAIPDYATLGSKLSWGSSSSLGGGSFSYHPDADLGIYFNGRDVNGVGVTKTDFIAALNKNATQLSLGKTVSIVFPISGTFIDGSVIESIQFMFAHGDNGYAFTDKSISVSNIEFVTNTLFLSGSSEYILNGNSDKPQLTVNSTNTLKTEKAYDKIKFSIKAPDIVALRDAIKVGSASTVGGGSFSYDANKDLAIYFNGTNVSGVGVSQYELFDFFNQYQEEFEASETMTVTLPLSGRFEDGGLITGLNLMLSNGSAAEGLNGIEIKLSDIEFLSSSILLAGGPEYTMVSGNYTAQLTVSSNALPVKSSYKKLTFDIALEDARNLVANMTLGSPSSLGGGSYTYGNSDLAIYFNGTNVKGIGITQGDFFSFLRNETNLSALANGETLTVTLPIGGTFSNDSVITGINLAVSHPKENASTDHSVFNGAKISLSNMYFPVDKISTIVEVVEPDVELKDGPDFKFSGSEWWPQLTVNLAEEYVIPEDVIKLSFNIKIPDYSTLRPLMSLGSRSTLGGGSFSYGGNDLGIYFEGTGVTGVGITQGDLFAAFDKNGTALAAGELVNITLPLRGTLEENATITAINVMITHGGNAATFSGKAVTISDIDFITPSPSNILKGGPDYTFSGNDFYPQLTVSTYTPIAVDSSVYKLKLDIKIPDYATLRPLMKYGSREVAGGGSFGYGGSDLGIYFEGTSYIGVNQSNLFAAFDANAAALSAGETVTLSLPISGTFEDDDIITAVKFMITHGANAASFAGKAVYISNMEIIRKTDNNILSDGPKYKFSSSAWWPQLTVKTTEPIAVNAETRTIRFSIRIPDYKELRPLMTWGSREVAGGGSFGYGGSDLGIYFSGTGFTTTGVTQSDLFTAFDKNSEALSQGKRVTLTLPITGSFDEGDTVTGINIMITHGESNAPKFANKIIALSNVELLAHVEGEVVIENVISGDCLNKGSFDEVVYCNICGKELSRLTIETVKSSHNVVVDKAVEPTYTETGLTEGSHCDVCGEVIVAQEIIPTKPYTLGDATGDNKIDILDMITLKNAILNNAQYTVVVDMNKDGVINSLDYTALKKLLWASF